MKEAIDGDVLCKYDYFPIFIDLTSEPINTIPAISVRITSYSNLTLWFTMLTLVFTVAKIIIKFK